MCNSKQPKVIIIDFELLIRKANITSLGVKFKINNFELHITHMYIIVIILGVLAILYHAHIWLFDDDDESKSSSL